MQRKAIQYDPTGDDHYDAASALIKSIRGSDPDAGLYWLARMLEGGEDVRFLARRLVILASEDVGNADPHALPLAVAAMQACEFVGLPECQLTLAQAVTYLACAPKSNAATVAIGEARPTSAKAGCCPCRATCATPTTRARSGSATAKATSMPTTPGRRCGARLSGRGTRILSAGRPRIREGAGRAARSDSGEAAGKTQLGLVRTSRVKSYRSLRTCRLLQHLLQHLRDDLDLLVVQLYGFSQLRQLLDQFAGSGHETTQADERSHDLDIDLHGSR